MKTNLLILLTAILIVPSIGAQTWQRVNFPVHETITGICFVNANRGYVVTSGAAIGITTDGGKTWSAYRMKYDIPLEDVYFLNKDTGFVCGRKGLVSRTLDGGTTWEDRSIEDTTAYLLSIRPVNDSIVLTLGIVRETAERLVGVAYRSTDGGKKYTKLPGMGLGYGELFYRPGSPICFQSWGLLHYSTDLGATWQSLKTVEGRPGRATAFYGKTGIICGNNGMAAFTHDGGKTWTKIAADEEVHFTSVVLVNDQVGYMAGTKGTITKTVDGGKTWKQETIPTSVDIFEMYLVGNTLYAAGRDGQIIRTTVSQGAATEAKKSSKR
jgi:photosystem II stability/assembly factor-like uncharacterized protein